MAHPTKSVIYTAWIIKGPFFYF